VSASDDEKSALASKVSRKLESESALYLLPGGGASLVDSRPGEPLQLARRHGLRGARLLSRFGARFEPSAVVGAFTLEPQEALAVAKGESGGMMKKGSAAEEVRIHLNCVALPPFLSRPFLHLIKQSLSPQTP